MLTEVGSSVNLDVCISCNLLNGLCVRSLVFVENVVVTWSVEKVDHRAIGIRGNAIGIFGLENMAVRL